MSQLKKKQKKTACYKQYMTWQRDILWIKWQTPHRLCFTCNILASDLWQMTCEPTTGAQVLSVKTFLMNGSCSPCLITMLAIWMTGSLSASGKTPTVTQSHNHTQHQQQPLRDEDSSRSAKLMVILTLLWSVSKKAFNVACDRNWMCQGGTQNCNPSG